MTQRLRDVFARRDPARPLFMPYVTAAYPKREDTVPILLALEAGGADVIELGVPFTDPLADGATIQHANEIAVVHGAHSLADCLALVAEARQAGLGIPVLLMGYYNPLIAFGESVAPAAARTAGADGFIVVDLPPEEAETFRAACREADMSFVPLVAPTSSDARIKSIAAVADTFLYCVSVAGTTGARTELSTGLEGFLARVRTHTDLPLAVGFGISTPEHVKQVGAIAEAVVVGSAIISAIDAAADGQSAQAVQAFVEHVTGR